MSSFRLPVGTAVQFGKETWIVERVGQDSMRLNGVWVRVSQVKRWLRNGDLIIKDRGAVEGEHNAENS